MSSKSSRLVSVLRSCATRAGHAPAVRLMPRALASSSIARRKSLVSETMPRSGSKTLPSWVGSMSTWMKVRSPL